MVRLLGTTSSTAHVAAQSAAASSVTVNKKDRAYGAEFVPTTNSGNPAAGTVRIFSALVGGGAGGKDLIRTEQRAWQIGKQTQTLSYDQDGNLISDGLWDYTYDAENRLTQMVTTGTANAVGIQNRTLQFKYDYAGRRVQKRSLNTSLSTDVTTRYLYDGWNVVAELDSTGANLLRTLAWGLDVSGSLDGTGGIGALLQIQDLAASKTMFAAYDGGGNISALVNASSGALEAVYEYGPFGELLHAEGAYARANPFRFSTKFQDDESGLVYYGLRYYACELGRFINRDPIEESGGLNLYGFAGNDGVNRADYLGMESPSMVDLQQWWIYATLSWRWSDNDAYAYPAVTPPPVRDAVAHSASDKNSFWGRILRSKTSSTIPLSKLINFLSDEQLGTGGIVPRGGNDPISEIPQLSENDVNDFWGIWGGILAIDIYGSTDTRKKGMEIYKKNVSEGRLQVAQAITLKRPDGSDLEAVEYLKKGLARNKGRFKILIHTRGGGNEIDREITVRKDGSSVIGIYINRNDPLPIILVDILHELAHAIDKLDTAYNPFERSARDNIYHHDEIYRMGNQVLWDLGFHIDYVHTNNHLIDNPGKYITPLKRIPKLSEVENVK